MIKSNDNQRVVQPYLFFNGSCEKAIDFYRKTLGAEVEQMVRYNESPEPAPPGKLPSGFEKKNLHASLRIGETTLMLSDGCSTEKPKFEGFSLSITVPTEDDAQRVFKGLSNGGEVQMPLTKTFWSPSFGMLEDQFGVGWMVMVPQEVEVGAR